jgi:hypothetical protein
MRLIIDNSRHLKLKENLLWLGTATLVTVVIWVVYAIYVAYNKPQLDLEVQSLLAPLDPNLDEQTIQMLGEPITLPEEFTPIVIPDSAPF